MAMSPSPQPASIMGSSRRLQRQDSNSPAPQPQVLSKKDKKRDQIRTGYLQRRDDFTKDRDTYYRIALQTLQIDISLITAADPHRDEPLANDPEEIDRMVRECIQNNMMKHFSAEPPPQSGRVYAKFAKACNDAAEDRDASLVTLMRDTEVKMAELDSEKVYRKKLADNEYKALAGSLRDRLINSLTSKRNRLNKDKELDISDGTAMLLHPSQYGLANPSSPGGMHSKRTTRRGRDVEEPATFPETNKRKRKAQESDESPAPTRPRLENINGSHTPREKEWLAEKKLLTDTQIESALYSVEKLFTEKELSMSYNTAALAAHNYILRHSSTANNLDFPVNGNSSSSSDNGKPNAVEATNENDDVDSPAPGGAMMERQYSHATRSTRGAYTNNFGLDALDDAVTLSLPSLQALTRHIPKLPPLLTLGQASRSVTKTESAPTCAGLSAEDAAIEVEAIRKARLYNDTHGFGKNLDVDDKARELLDQASQIKRRWVPTESKQNLPVPRVNGNGSGTTNGSVSLNRVRDEGGEPMSRNVSQQ